MKIFRFEIQSINPSWLPPEQFEVQLERGQEIVSIETVTDKLGYAAARVWVVQK